MAASALLLSSAYKDIDPVPTYFSEIDPVSPYFVSLKILPMERSSASQSLKKKIINQILNYSSFCFEIPAYLGHLFTRNVTKNETKNVNKNSLFCSIFEILLNFRPLELRK